MIQCSRLNFLHVNWPLRLVHILVCKKRGILQLIQGRMVRRRLSRRKSRRVAVISTWWFIWLRFQFTSDEQTPDQFPEICLAKLESSHFTGNSIEFNANLQIEPWRVLRCTSSGWILFMSANFFGKERNVSFGLSVWLFYFGAWSTRPVLPFIHRTGVLQMHMQLFFSKLFIHSSVWSRISEQKFSHLRAGTPQNTADCQSACQKVNTGDPDHRPTLSARKKSPRVTENTRRESAASVSQRNSTIHRVRWTWTPCLFFWPQQSHLYVYCWHRSGVTQWPAPVQVKAVLFQRPIQESAWHTEGKISWRASHTRVGLDVSLLMVGRTNRPPIRWQEGSNSQVAPKTNLLKM